MRSNKITKPKFEKLKMTLLVIFLFVTCVGGVELAICYWHDPLVFKKIVTPVQVAAKNIAQSTISYSKQFAKNTGDWFLDCKNWFDNQLDLLGEKFSQAQEENQEQSSPINEDASTVMTRIDGIETLTGGLVPISYFAQNDPEWKDQLYGNDPIGVYGCGPTSLAMVINSLTSQETDPAKMAVFCAEQGYWAPKSGSYHNIVQGVAASFGLNCAAPASLDATELCNRLSSGEIAIALMGPGHFTNTGHFIVLRGLTDDGKVLVADPISRTRSLQEWDAQLIIDELSMSRSSGAPLWFLSASQ